MNTNNIPPPSLVTAPNKTLTAPAPTTARRPSANTQQNKKSSNDSSNNTSPLPRSPSLELSDSFSALSTAAIASLSPTSPSHHQQQQLLQANTNKYLLGSHHNKSSIDQQQPQQQHSQFFSATQLAAIKPICSATPVNDFTFLSIEKYPASHNP